MTAIFIKLVNMSIVASWLVLAVVLLRLVLRRAPKVTVLILWALVGVRLILPFSLESVFSLIPDTQTIPTDIVVSVDTPTNNDLSMLPPTQSGIETPTPDATPTIPQTPTQDAEPKINIMKIVIRTASGVWVAGAGVMLCYALASYIKMKRTVRESVHVHGNIMVCDNIPSPFILGIIRPKIYIPSSTAQSDTHYVLAHEKAHLKRLDHIWKPLGFLLLSVYWFNPMLWVAYILLCRDIELACDEKVIRQLGVEVKKPYSTALVNCSVTRRAITACPLAFGEVGVKKRVKTVLKYKKPTFLIIAIALIICVAFAGCFLTNPTSDDKTTTTITPETNTTQYVWTTNPRTIIYNGSTVPYTYDEATATWLTFSKTEHSTERTEVKAWLRDQLDELKQVMGDSYYDPEIYIAKYDIDNNGTTDYLVWLNHIAYSGSGGSSFYVMYTDGVKIVKEEYIAHFLLNASTIETEGNKQVGIFPAGECNDIYILGKIWMRSTTTKPQDTTLPNTNTRINFPTLSEIIAYNNNMDAKVANDVIPRVSTFKFDVDADGRKEFCTVAPDKNDPYNLFHFIVTGSSEDIRPEHYTAFSYDGIDKLEFTVTDEGRIVLQGKRNGALLTFDISVENGKIVLNERGGGTLTSIDKAFSMDAWAHRYSFDYPNNSICVDLDGDGKDETIFVGYSVEVSGEQNYYGTPYVECIVGDGIFQIMRYTRSIADCYIEKGEDGKLYMVQEIDGELVANEYTNEYGSYSPFLPI